MKILSWFATCLLLLAPASGWAARYVLEEGHGVAVCEAYEKNLNSFAPKVPMTCNRPVNKETLGFDEPAWDKVEGGGLTTKGVPIYTLNELIGEFLWKRDANPVYQFGITKWPEWQGTPKQLKVAHDAYMRERSSRDVMLTWRRVDEFDIDNDGVPEPVWFEQPCGSSFGAFLVVLTPDHKAIDRVKTERVMPHPPFKDRSRRGVFRSVKQGDWGIPPSDIKRGYGPAEDAIHGLYYDLFFYQGRTYFDQWWAQHPDFKGRSDVEVGRLRVFEATPQATRQLCSYRFTYDN